MLRLHAAADGHLLRIRVPGGHLTAAALEAIGDLAELGNGIIELTSRASIQVRGLDADRAVAASERLAAAGLLPSAVHDRVRNILASPFGGRVDGALLSTDKLVARIDRGLRRDAVLASLPGRFLFAVEDGSRVLGGGQGDVTLVAEPGDGTGARLRLHLVGRPTTRTADPETAADLALDAARAFLAVLATIPEAGDDPVWRIADLPEAPLIGLLDRLGTGFTTGPALGSGRQVAAGSLRQADGGYAVTALAPLGRLDAIVARGLATLAASSGGQVRVSPWRNITMVDVPESRLRSVADGLDELGLVLDEASGWQNLSACAGLGACARARLDVRAAATVRAGIRGTAHAGMIEHWSACERRCGRPTVVAHAVTATGEGIEVELGGGTTTHVQTLQGALQLLAADCTRLPSEASPDGAVALAGGGTRP